MDFLASIIGGGVTGLLGTALSGGLAFLKDKQKHAQELDLRRIDLDEIRLEAETAERRAAIDLEMKQTEADAEAMAASYQDAATPWSKGLTLTPRQAWPILFVDLVRGLMRPFLTCFSMFVLFYVYHSQGKDSQMTDDIVHTINYIATTAVLWWFGSRQTEKLHKGGAR